MFDLSIFCFPHHEETRYRGIREPFRIGEWRYATDGRICVRIPADNQPEAIGEVPKADKEFRKFNAEACTEPWPRWNGETEFVKYSYRTRMVRGKLIEDRKAAIYEIAVQTIAGRVIGGMYWFKVASLGHPLDVFYDQKGAKTDRICFVCGDLQGLLMPTGKREPRREPC